jgi:hypothetical protein
VDEGFAALVYVPGGKPGTLNRSLIEDIHLRGGAAHRDYLLRFFV